MKKPFLKYAGDKKIHDLLEHYTCPVPFHAVRTRFLGNIASLKLDASPVQAIKDLWGGELPEFDDMDAVNALFQDLMGLWNVLARHQSRTKPFRLSRGTTGSTSDDLQRFCRTRTEEFEGFIDGLFGAEEAVDLPERAVEGMEELGKINPMFHAATELASREEKQTSSHDDIATAFRNLKQYERFAEKEIHAVILSCKKARAQSMTWDDTPPPRPIIERHSSIQRRISPCIHDGSSQARSSGNSKCAESGEALLRSGGTGLRRRDDRQAAEHGAVIILRSVYRMYIITVSRMTSRELLK